MHLGQGTRENFLCKVLSLKTIVMDQAPEAEPCDSEDEPEQVRKGLVADVSNTARTGSSKIAAIINDRMSRCATSGGEYRDDDGNDAVGL